MTSTRQWSLGTKLALLGTPFLLLVLLSTVATLWISWQLDGGAAAVNEAGRLRMQAYRLAWTSVWDGEGLERRQMLQGFDRSIALLERGDVERPLFVPWDAEVRRDFAFKKEDRLAGGLVILKPVESPPEKIVECLHRCIRLGYLFNQRGKISSAKDSKVILLNAMAVISDINLTQGMEVTAAAADP